VNEPQLPDSNVTPPAPTIQSSPSPQSGNPGSGVISVSQFQFSGPLPPPQILAMYNDIVPNGAERIIAMAENDARHVQDMERIRIEGDRDQKRRGQNYALILALTSLGLTAWALYMGHDTAAIAFGTTTVLGLVSAFVLGRIIRSSN
jgi:uncharacterized membrane protein